MNNVLNKITPLLVVDSSVDTSVEADWVQWYGKIFLGRINSFGNLIDTECFVSRTGGGTRYISLHSLKSENDISAHQIPIRSSWDTFSPHVQSTARVYLPLEQYSQFDIHTAHLLVVDAMIDSEVESEWNKWYDNIHMPSIANCPGFTNSARYRTTFGGGVRYLSLYELDSPEALVSSEFNERRGWEHFAANVQATVRLFERL